MEPVFDPTQDSNFNQLLLLADKERLTSQIKEIREIRENPLADIIPISEEEQMREEVFQGYGEILTSSTSNLDSILKLLAKKRFEYPFPDGEQELRWIQVKKRGKRLSQNNLASLFGVSKATIDKTSRGIRLFSESQMVSIARRLGIPEDHPLQRLLLLQLDYEAIRRAHPELAPQGGRDRVQPPR